MLGTAAYMSPEQARGREGDRRSDIWAFGAVLFEMLSGQRAFTGRDVPETIAAVMPAEIAWSRLPAPTPQPLRQLVARCLERDADAAATRHRRSTHRSRRSDSRSAAITHPPRRRAAALATFVRRRRRRWPAVRSWPVFSRPPPRARQSLALRLMPPAEAPAGRSAVSRFCDHTRRHAHRLQGWGARPHAAVRPSPRPARTRAADGPACRRGPSCRPTDWVGYFEPGAPGAAFKKVPFTGGPPSSSPGSTARAGARPGSTTDDHRRVRRDVDGLAARLTVGW